MHQATSPTTTWSVLTHDATLQSGQYNTGSKVKPLGFIIIIMGIFLCMHSTYKPTSPLAQEAEAVVILTAGSVVCYGGGYIAGVRGSEIKTRWSKKKGS
jgi:hypothetical protein